MYRNLQLEANISQLHCGLYFNGSGGDSDADVTSRVEPWSAAKDHFSRLYVLASGAYDATDKTPYPGEFYALANTYDDLAQSQVVFAAEQMAIDAERVRALGTRTVTGGWLDPSSNPILVNSITTAVEKANAALLEDVIPQVLDIAVKNGAYSGTASDIIIDRALEGFSREALRATTGIYYENFTRERALQANGVDMLRAAEMIEFEKSKLYQANADMVRQLEQMDLDNQIAHYEDELKAIWRGMDQYMAMMTGGSFTDTTTHDPSKKKNVLGSSLQGAVGGASLGASVGGGPGAIVGGILGGVAGLLG